MRERAWVWAAIGVALVVHGACGGGGEPADPAKVARGKEIYSFEGCSACHGSIRQGSLAGPSLEALRRHWSAQELQRYLANPAGYPADRRLVRLQERYPAAMAGLPGADEARLQTLVSFLLSP